MRSKVTIKDVAAHCGYSFKTVARVVNGEATVDPVIRERVKDAIKVMGYKTNVVARSLRSSTSYLIGLVYEHPMADVQKGVLDACQEQGYGLQILPVDHKSPSLEIDLVKAVELGKLAGIVLTPPVSEDTDLMAALRQHGVPFCTLVSGQVPLFPNEPCVYVNDHRAALDVTEHLISLGHREIAFIWGDSEHGSSKARYAGYAHALRKHSIAVRKKWVANGVYTFESGLRCATQLLADPKRRPTAIVGCNDEIAAGALIAARMQGLAVPQDISIAGFEDSRFSREAWPPITTARQPTEEIARKAAELLIGSIKVGKISGASSGGALAAGFTPELVVRPSTGIAFAAA